MATTKIWKIKNRLDHVLDYIANPIKTNDKKYVTGINCLSETAFQEMNIVKNQFHKTDGIIGYHAYQSFKGSEVTPEEAHKIGIRLAEELWGDKFQVVVATHLNTNNIHNHFTINSVSFVDGKKYYDNKKNYAIMRKTSDKLCEEYGLSVLKQEEKYNKYASNDLYKELMKYSIDYAIENAKDYNDFIKILYGLDYIVTERNGELSIRREPYKRNTRIARQFGNMYSKELIYKRILETQPEFIYSPEPYLMLNERLNSYYEIQNRYFQNNSSFRQLILYYEKLFVINIKNYSKSNLTKYTPQLINEIKKLDEFSKQIRFLCKNKIQTEKDLIDFKKSANDKIVPLKSERENLWKKHKRAKTKEEKLLIENRITEISKEIYPISEDIKYCKKLYDNVQDYKAIELHQKMVEEKEQLDNVRNKSKKKNKVK
jgi:hypothetical protein